MTLGDGELIERAKPVLNPGKVKHRGSVGEVACAWLTDKNNLYLGDSSMPAAAWVSCRT
jgi:hypothetical protein